MKNDGMIRVPFKDEDRLARQVRSWHGELWTGLVGMLRDLEAEREGVRDASIGDLIRRLADLIGARGLDAREARVRLNAELVRAVQGWMDRFSLEGDEQLVASVMGSLPAREVFGTRIEQMHELYLDEALERVLGEQDDLKAQFLLKVGDYVEGKTETLEADALVREMEQTSARRAKFFARDQYSRLERSLQMATFEQGDAPYVEVFNSHDGRVRDDHQDWPKGWGRCVFTPEGLRADLRWQSYNCRCGFVARWELDDRMKQRFVA